MRSRELNAALDQRLREAARQWFDLASRGEIKTADIFFRFVAAYHACMAILTNKYGQLDRDVKRLERFSREAEIALKNCSRVREYRNAVDRLAAKPIYNMQTKRPNKRTKNLKEILDCTRYVRNNLFHAGRTSAIPDRSLEASYTVVSKLIDLIWRRGGGVVTTLTAQVSLAASSQPLTSPYLPKRLVHTSVRQQTLATNRMSKVLATPAAGGSFRRAYRRLRGVESTRMKPRRVNQQLTYLTVCDPTGK